MLKKVGESIQIWILLVSQKLLILQTNFNKTIYIGESPRLPTHK